MPKVARVTDKIEGLTSGEHHGHYPNGSPAHPIPCKLTGTITNGASNVFINGMPAAFYGSNTDEDDCCGPGNGIISEGSPNIFVNGKPLARVFDKVNPHNGEANIITGSSNVFAN